MKTRDHLVSKSSVWCRTSVRKEHLIVKYVEATIDHSIQY